MDGPAGPVRRNKSECILDATRRPAVATHSVPEAAELLPVRQAPW